MSFETSFQTFVDPPREFGLIPFWFWNDNLEEEELIRQLRAFHAAGFGGVLPHARIGLSRRVGYLTDEFFRLMRRVVEEAAALDMKVILYDEGSYPSGSANGAVVAENPDFATRAIKLLELDIEGPHQGFWRPNTGRALLDRHVCTMLGRLDANGGIDPGSLQSLTAHEHTIFRVDVPAGRWKAMSVWNVASGGSIRGAYADGESAHATAPPSSDILNPEAVACFIRLTHDRYYEELSEFFGTTIIAMFTDEPSELGVDGRVRRGEVKAFTHEFDAWREKHWGFDPRPWLPALWLDYGDDTAAFRKKYEDAVQARLQETFYQAQSRWCEDHGIALTGHPGAANDMTLLRWFQLPGQDIVWRNIEPAKESRLEGSSSIVAKAATSGARLSNRRRVLTEVCGAYDWHLTLDEVKWLFDWHIVRGNNLINPHAVFYSIRDRRAWESEPDLALHNVWWPYFGDLATYAQRLCWLLCDGEHVCQVAIFGDGYDLPWQAARQLYERQIDFLYIDDQAVVDAAVDEGQLVVGEQRYLVVVVDSLPYMTDAAREKLNAFEKAGGIVIHFSDDVPLAEKIDAVATVDAHLSPAHPDLRFIHYRKSDLDFYLLVNEGEARIDGELTLAVSGAVEIWDAFRGIRRELGSRSTEAGLQLDIELERRESLVVAVNSSGSHLPAQMRQPDLQQLRVDVEWTVASPGGDPVDLDLGDWARRDGFELFTGTLSYHAELDIPQADEVSLDLGAVGDIAELFVDGERQGAVMWAPYRLNLGPVTPGRHAIEVRVTNSMANSYDGRQMPSGLMGPVTLLTANDL